MTPCARNHPVHGRHAPGCTCTPECRDHDNHCAGCAPTEATNGLLCPTDSRRIRAYLGAEEGLDPEHPAHGLPWAYDHLADAYPSLSQAPGGGGGSGPSDREAERLVSVLTLRDDIGDVLAAWTDALAEQSRLTGPDLTVALGSPPPSAWFRSAEARSLSRRTRVRRRAEWLLTHVEALEAHPAVADAWEEVADLMSRAHALAPWRPAPTHLDGIPCRCGAMALHDHGDEVVCWACRWSFSREQYGIWVKVLGRRYGDEPERASIERRRLEHSTAGPGGRA